MGPATAWECGKVLYGPMSGVRSNLMMACLKRVTGTWVAVGQRSRHVARGSRSDFPSQRTSPASVSDSRARLAVGRAMLASSATCPVLKGRF